MRKRFLGRTQRRAAAADRDDEAHKALSNFRPASSGSAGRQFVSTRWLIGVVILRQFNRIELIAEVIEIDISAAAFEFAALEIHVVRAKGVFRR